MANESDAPQVETAPVSQEPATAQPDSQAGAITIATPEQLAEAEREFENYYSDTPTPAPAGVDGAATVEPAQAESEQPSEQQPTEEQPAEVQTPPEEPAGDINAPDKLRVRLSHDDDIAIAAIQRARKLASFGEAAKVYYGLTQPAAAAPAPAAIPEENATREAQAREQAQSQNAAADLNAQWTANAELVKQANPDLSNPKSVLYNMAALARAEMKERNDPILSQPTAPQAILEKALAKMRDMGLATAAVAPAAVPPKAPVSAPVPPSPAAPPPRRVAPASGSQGQQNGDQSQTVAAAIAATNDPKELERLFDEAAENGSLAAAFRR